MIEKLIVGKRYNIIGNGNWSDVDLDLVVLGVTVYSQLSAQDVNLYDTWFADRDLDENLLEEFMVDDPYIYHCRKLISRDPSIEENNGDEVYIFPGMINYVNSSQLIDAEIYAYRITMSPFTPSDKLNPYVRNTDINIRNSLREHMRKLVYDGAVRQEPVGKILVTDAEYDVLNATRTAIKAAIDAETDEDSAAIAEERMYLYSAQEANQILSQTLSDKQKDIDKEMMKASQVLSEAYERETQTLIMTEKLKSKYNAFVRKIQEWNNAHPDNQEDIPVWDEIN